MTATEFPCAAGCGAMCKDFPRRKTRLCAVCTRSANGRSPSKIEKSRAAMKARLADPATRAAHIAYTSAGLRRRLAADPAEAARRAEQCRALGKSMIGHAAQPAGSEPRRRVATKQIERTMGWCPPAYRDEYRRLVNNMKIKAVDARAMIEQQVAADQAKLPVFERQLMRLRSGEAKAVNKFKPRVDAGPFTLGGVASGMI